MILYPLYLHDTIYTYIHTYMYQPNITPLFLCICLYIPQQEGPLEKAPASLGDLCSSESLQTADGYTGCLEACAPAQCCQTDLGGANCGFMECQSYGVCSSLLAVDPPVSALPEVELPPEVEDPFDKLACPDGHTLDTFLPQLNGDNCIVCVAPAVSRDNTTGVVMVAQEDCVATCGIDTCDFVPEGCGVLVCPETDAPTVAVAESPTAAPTVRTVRVTAAPTIGDSPGGNETTTAPTPEDPTSAAAGGRMAIMAMTTVVGTVALLWA